MDKEKEKLNKYLVCSFIFTMICTIFIITATMKIDIPRWLKTIRFWTIILFPMISLILNSLYHYKYKFDKKFVKFGLVKYITLFILIFFSLTVIEKKINANENVVYIIIFYLDCFAAISYLIFSVVCYVNVIGIRLGQFLLMVVVTLIFGNTSEVIRALSSIISVMTVSALDYEFLRVAYKKYIKYKKFHPQKGELKSRILYSDQLDKTKTITKTRLNTLKVLFGLGTGLFNLLLWIINTGFVSEITESLLYKIQEHLCLTTDVIFANLSMQLWIGLVKIVEIIIFVVILFLIIVALEKIYRNKIDKAFSYIFAIQEEERQNS